MAERNRSGHWRDLLGEALVVFLGVFGAFQLDSCRERAAEAERREQIVEILAADFDEGAEQVEWMLGWFDEQFGGFLAAYEAGEKPRPVPIPIPAIAGSDGWSGMLAGGALSSLEPEVLRAVERFVGQTAALVEGAREYNAYLREVLVHDLEKPTEAFYAEEGTTLRPAYLWYWYSLRSIRGSLEAALAQAVAAREMLEE